MSGRAATPDEPFALFVLPEVEVLLRVARTLTQTMPMPRIWCRTP